jgi:hypothetical protein
MAGGERSRSGDAAGWAAFALALGVGALWLGSAFVHLHNPYAFFRAVLGYQLLPPRAAAAVAGWLPWWLLTLGAGLALPTWRRAAAWASLATGLAFVAAQASALARGLDISCGCFGTDGAKIHWGSMAPAVLAAAGGGAVGWLTRPRAEAAPRQDTNEPTPTPAGDGVSASPNCSS